MWEEAPLVMREAMKDGVIVEFLRVGNAIKVSAVDPKTLVEVSMVGAPDAGEELLKRLIIRKLEYVLKRRQR
jgi:hypothetical protein